MRIVVCLFWFVNVTLLPIDDAFSTRARLVTYCVLRSFLGSFTNSQQLFRVIVRIFHANATLLLPSCVVLFLGKKSIDPWECRALEVRVFLDFWKELNWDANCFFFLREAARSSWAHGKPLCQLTTVLTRVRMTDTQPYKWTRKRPSDRIKRLYYCNGIYARNRRSITTKWLPWLSPTQDSRLGRGWENFIEWNFLQKLPPDCWVCYFYFFIPMSFGGIETAMRAALSYSFSSER